MNGGEKGIRTLGTVSRTHAFQACSLNHSDISPFKWESTVYRDVRPAQSKGIRRANRG